MTDALTEEVKQAVRDAVASIDEDALLNLSADDIALVGAAAAIASLSLSVVRAPTTVEEVAEILNSEDDRPIIILPDGKFRDAALASLPAPAEGVDIEQTINAIVDDNRRFGFDWSDSREGLRVVLNENIRALLSRLEGGEREGWRLVPKEPTETMLNAGALAWNGHRCGHGENSITNQAIRKADACWNENENCRCRFSYEGAKAGYCAMLAAAPVEEPTP